MHSVETENKRLREQLAVLKGEAAKNEGILRRVPYRPPGERTASLGRNAVPIS